MFYAPREWDCAQAFSVVYGHDYRQPMAIAQVLPALVGKSYLEAASLECTASSGMSLSLQSLKLVPIGVQKGMEARRWSTQDPAGRTLTPCGPWRYFGCPPGPSPLPTAHIQVHYSIINTLQGKHFHKSISVRVPAGSTLLRVLQAAEKKEPDVFR